MKRFLIISLLCLIIVNSIYYGLPLFICQHKEVETLGRMNRVYCKRCRLRVVNINGEWKVLKDNPLKRWWHK